MSPRKIPDTVGHQALHAWRQERSLVERDQDLLALAVRYALQQFRAIAPGRSVEVRVPPFGAVQAVEGHTHSRGTPPAVVELGPAAWLDLVTGRASWQELVDQGQISASGERSDLRAFFPLA